MSLGSASLHPTPFQGVTVGSGEGLRWWLLALSPAASETAGEGLPAASQPGLPQNK